MMHYPEAVEALIAALKQLPGIGRRGAERLALSLLEWEPEKLEFLGRLLGTLPETVGSCPVCGALADGIACFLLRVDGNLAVRQQLHDFLIRHVATDVLENLPHQFLVFFHTVSSPQASAMI